MQKSIIVGSTEYKVSALTTGEVQIEEKGGSNLRWFNSKAEFLEWSRYLRN